jgi:hypothetical protein
MRLKVVKQIFVITDEFKKTEKQIKINMIAVLQGHYSVEQADMIVGELFVGVYWIEVVEQYKNLVNGNMFVMQQLEVVVVDLKVDYCMTFVVVVENVREVVAELVVVDNVLVIVLLRVVVQEDFVELDFVVHNMEPMQVLDLLVVVVELKYEVVVAGFVVDQNMESKQAGVLLLLLPLLLLLVVVVVEKFVMAVIYMYVEALVVLEVVVVEIVYCMIVETGALQLQVVEKYLHIQDKLEFLFLEHILQFED